MNDRKLVKTETFSSTVLGVCCFTPLLVIAHGAVGLSAWLA